MKITEIRVYPVDEEKLKAYITIIIDDCFVVRDLKVIKGNAGLFVAMPNKKRRDGMYRDIAHPLNQETRTQMEEMILKAYLDELNKNPSAESSSAQSGEDDFQ